MTSDLTTGARPGLRDSHGAEVPDVRPRFDTPVETVSVVVCAYSERRWEDLCATVASLRAQTRPPIEIVLVVDHCPALAGRARQAFSDRRSPPVVVVENEDPPGLSHARNSGVGVARGSIVAFIDDDAVADSEWLDCLLVHYADGGTAGVGGRVVPRWDRGRPAWFPPEFDWVVGCSHSGMPTSTATVRNFVGTNMSFRRSALDRLGGFSSQLGRIGRNGAGCEETELCIRAGGDGSALVYEPQAVVRHTVPSARATWRYFLRRCYSEGQSKATVSAIAGASAALSDERRYVRSTVPTGLVRNLSTPHRSGSIGRVLALVLGVTVTALGYVRSKAARRAFEQRVRVPWLPERAPAFQPPVSAAQTTRPRTIPLGWFGLAASTGLYISTVLSHVAVGSMGGFGLVTVLPVFYWVGLGVLTLSFCWSVRAKQHRPLLLALHVVLLIAYLHLTPVLLYGTLRYAWAWKHVGMTNFIIVHHHVDLYASSDQQLVAYQDWPGFFALNAFLDVASGIGTPLHYAAWGPPFNELLYAAPLMLIFRSFTTDPKVRWTALWIFYLGNWVGQDYFSPQAFAYFFYLVIVAVCLTRLVRGRRSSLPGQLAIHQPALEEPPRPLVETAEGSSGRAFAWVDRHQKLLLMVMLTLMMAAVASSHQLTPFMILSVLILLAAFRRLSAPGLIVIAALVTFGWIFFAARTFLDQNIHSIISSIGNPLGNTTSSLINLQRASPDQILVARIDRFLTAAVIALAVIGWMRSRNTLFAGRRWGPAVLLVAAPVAALVANDYGGEMAFRVFLFALPALAILGAGAFVPGGFLRSRWVLDVSRALVLAGLLAAALFAYYGKEQSNYFSPGEVRTMQQLYSSAPSGSTIISATSNLPWGFAHFDSFKYYWYTSDTPRTVQAILDQPAAVFKTYMASQRSAYLVFSKSVAADVTATGLLPPGSLGHIQEAIARSPQFKVVDRGPGITVYALNSGRVRP